MVEALSTFFDMGGYGAYVWPSIVITVVVLGGLLVASVRFMRARQGTLASLSEASQETGGERSPTDETQA